MGCSTDSSKRSNIRTWRPVLKLHPRNSKGANLRFPSQNSTSTNYWTSDLNKPEKSMDSTHDVYLKVSKHASETLKILLKLSLRYATSIWIDSIWKYKKVSSQPTKNFNRLNKWTSESVHTMLKLPKCFSMPKRFSIIKQTVKSVN